MSGVNTLSSQPAPVPASFTESGAGKRSSWFSTFYGIFRCEYLMSIRRKGLWISFILIDIFFSFSLVFSVSTQDGVLDASFTDPWRYAARIAFLFNAFMPIIGGILSADRIIRDRSLGMDELLRSSPLNRWVYILGKMAGALLSILTLVFLSNVIFIADALRTGMSFEVVKAALLCFLLMIVPGFIFITAFSIALPVILPVRVYQVLYTGYWFWGNYLNRDQFPTLAGTWLTPCGKIAMIVWFKGGSETIKHYPYTTIDGIGSIALLIACAAGVLFCLERYLAWKNANA